MMLNPELQDVYEKFMYWAKTLQEREETGPGADIYKRLNLLRAACYENAAGQVLAIIERHKDEYDERCDFDCSYCHEDDDLMGIQ